MRKRDDPSAMAEYRRKYNASEKGRESRKRYAATSKGRGAQLRAKRRYNQANSQTIRDADMRRRLVVAERINRLKVERGCADCGFNQHPAALDFDHLDGTTKTANVSRLARNSWDAVEAEIRKCEVVCANCHRIRTAARLTGHFSGVRARVVVDHPSLFEGAG